MGRYWLLRAKAAEHIDNWMYIRNINIESSKDSRGSVNMQQFDRAKISANQ